MIELWHYTCAHSCQQLGEEGVLLPVRALAGPDAFADWEEWRQPLADLIWLTDLDAPMRTAVGLTSYTLGCDRTAYRYAVTDASTVVPYTSMRRRLPKELRDDLESAQGVMPRHWWVSWDPVPVRYEPVSS